MKQPSPSQEHNLSCSAAPVQPLRVLLVEDSEDDAALLVRELYRGGYDVSCERVDTLAAMSAAVSWRTWDIIIADYAMPRFSGLAALELVKNAGLDVPFILVSGTIGEDIAVAAMKAGAHDYLMKDNLLRLVPAVQRELREAEMRRQRARAEVAWREEAQVSAALVRVASELIALVDTPHILDCLCQYTVEQLGCDASHAFLWHPEESAYVPVSSFGDTPEQWEALRVLKIPRGLATDPLARLEHEAVVQVPIVREPSDALSVLAARFGTSVALCVQLRRREEPIGVLTAAYRGGQKSFTPLQERIARGIGQLASMALENARLVEELERANHLKAEFVATISHELRTPLNVIVGYTDLLIEGEFGPLTPEQIEPLQRADKSARELMDLIVATLDLSRLEAGRLPVAPTEVSLRVLVQEIIAETKLTTAKPGVRLLWNVAASLPQLHTDPVKVKVIIKNLITNAVKFTEHGKVTVDARERDGGVEIGVTDTGIGIAPEALPIIFEPFRQADSSPTRAYGGVGLGLYIVRRLVDILDAHITVESEVGRGSTFRVWFPAGAKPERRTATA